ncbi:hypothetical protein V1264_009740 [Littorina saxatilis]|uniref:Uncharacterized protein n=2 Tax=Littorina saxatilis TaxID=31220 RepID=A0AAN9AS20_9CAEN
MTAITRTSPLDLGDLRKTQRRVAALLNAPDFCTCLVRRKRIPAGFCYLCSQLDPRGRGSRSNPYRHLLARGVLKPCPHLPPAPHPTFVDDDDEDEYDDEDDGFDEESLDLDAGNQDGAMFDTKIVREDEDDPR